MAKYTTEVRTICEFYAGLEESVGFLEIDQVLEKSWDKIITSDVEFFIKSHKKEFCKKLLKHYYTREIGAETVGLWKLWINERLEILLPKYNQFYKSESFEIVNPFVNQKSERIMNDIGKMKEGATEEEDQNRNVSGKENKSEKVTEENATKEKFSDTPQGGLDGMENDKYLTNATISSNNSDRDYNADLEKEEKENLARTRMTEKEVTDSKNVTESIKGFNKSQAELLEEYRQSILNIDKIFIEEFEDLFISLW